MSHSEPRKPLNFPQRGRKQEWAKWVKGGGRGQMERKKKQEWQNVCQMRKGGKMKRIIRFPAVLHWLLKSSFAAAAPPFPFKPNSSSPTNNKHCQRAGQFSSNSQQFSTWPKLLNSVDLKWIHPGVSHCVEEYVRVWLMKEFQVGFSQLLLCYAWSVCACRLFCHLLHKLSSHDMNWAWHSASQLRLVPQTSFSQDAQTLTCARMFVFKVEVWSVLKVSHTYIPFLTDLISVQSNQSWKRKPVLSFLYHCSAINNQQCILM